jgi:hypothetical protein
VVSGSQSVGRWFESTPTEELHVAARTLGLDSTRLLHRFPACTPAVRVGGGSRRSTSRTAGEARLSCHRTSSATALGSWGAARPAAFAA